MDEITGREPGPTCPLCGHPLPAAQGDCPACPYRGNRPVAEQWGILTVFGYGMCGAAAVAAIGMAGSLAIATAHLQALTLLAVAGCGVVGWTLASGIGRRLDPAVRCAYEHLLLALDGAGLLAVSLALVGVTGWQTLATAWGLAVACGYWLMRRFGYQAGAGDPRGRGRKHL